jgi:S1-C subfamily serine protease
MNKIINTAVLACLIASAQTPICAAQGTGAKPKPAASGKLTVKTAPGTPSLTPDEAVNVRVYKQCNRAVVYISTIGAPRPEEVFLNVMPHQGSGSGCILTSDGYILTNNHVVKDAGQVRVTLWDGANLAAQVIGVDPENDIAVIKVDPGKRVLDVIPLGDSSKIEVGRRCFAIGNPFGLERTMTQGIISSVGRTLSTESGRLIKGVLQTDAAINPGNSGGPLIDAQGQMIGLNTAILSKSGQSSGISFAIPINVVKRIFPQLIQYHAVIRPDLGIQMVHPVGNGLRIIRLDPAGPSAAAGLTGPQVKVYRNGPFTVQAVDVQAADVIVQIDNVKVRTPDDLLSYVETKKAGQVVTLTILRQGKLVRIPVKLTTSAPG